MRNISAIFITKPVMTTLLVCGLFLFGLMGYFSLPISDLPNVDFPTITVSASLPGANPKTMASSVATPLEQEFSSIPGLNSMVSQSSQGTTNITLQFDLSRDIDSAAQDVQSAISAATPQLPENLPFLPTYKKVNPAMAPVLMLTLSSKNLPLSDVDNYAETILAQRISMINGVAEVDVYGSQKYAVRVELNPLTLSDYHLSFQQVVNAIIANNVNLSTGSLDGDLQSLPINSDGQLMSAAAYKPLVIAYRAGAPIDLQQLGLVLNSVANNQVASWYNGTRSIVLAIQKQPGSNTVAVVKNVMNILPAFRAQLPAEIKLNVMYDRTVSIMAALNEVKHTLFIAAVLVLLVIFVFLRNWRATLIPSIVLPVTLVGTFAFMSLMNFSIDIISLIALTLMVGLVIDDAFVMLENIDRHLAMGKTPLKAAYDGSKEISFTIFSITLSLAAVFIPILFMSGLVGRLFFEFAATACIALLLSGLLAMTLTPMLCSRLLKPLDLHPTKGWQRYFENQYEKLAAKYQQSLIYVLRHQKETFYVFITSIILVFALFVFIPKGFLPDQDIGQLLVFTQADPGIGFNAMVQKQQQIADIIAKDPNIEGYNSTVGAGGVSPTLNTGRIFIRLKPYSKRKLNADQIIQELRPKLTKVPGISAFLQNIPAISIGGKLTKSSYQFTLTDMNYDELEKWTAIFQQQMQKNKLFQDVTTDLQNQSPEIEVSIDRKHAANLGVSAQAIEETLNYAFAKPSISTIYAPMTTYDVIVQALPEFQQNMLGLSTIYVPASDNKLVPLDAVTNFSVGYTPLVINHQGQLLSATVSFNLAPHISIGQAVNAVKAIQSKLQPPLGLTATFQGTAQVFQSAQQGMLALLILTIAVIYIILGILYESFVDPLIILSGIPSAIFGGLFTLWLFNMPLDLYGFIGLILLVGIVKKNAIMMIDFANEANKNTQPIHAIFDACLIRFRPIIMTSMAAILGALPLMLAIGQGAEALKPMGVVIVGGLIFSQTLTLYITPVLYLLAKRLARKS